NALYVMNNMEAFYEEVEFRKNGIVKRRAAQVLDETVQFLDEVAEAGLFEAIEKGLFAEVKRPRNGGKGLDGVYEKGADYYNPCETYLKKELGVR
ncbi:MAG TPA: lysine 5,6-aminomutase subunit alpha, partial [Elusimicrobiales bacterium]|nr:lysine 5,6-aminomutase subunit alpha [Elusimicrobiales bacterium]